MGTQKPQEPWWHVYVVAVLSPVILVAIVCATVFFLVSSVCIHLLIWSSWCLRGRDILFVYSDSPIWHDYIQRHILPLLGNRAVIMNWSERKQWKWSLARVAFRHFGGHQQFNPLGIVFRPLRRTRIFRFWQPFHEHKQGRPERLQRMETSFFDCIGIIQPETGN